MGRQFMTEDEPDLTLPEDSIHRARLQEVKVRTFTYPDRDNPGKDKTGETLEWWWEVTRPGSGLGNEYIGRKVKGECKPRLSNRPGNRFREWAEALLDREIPVGMSVDLDDLIGLEGEIVIGHRRDKKDNAKVWEEVIGVLPASSGNVDTAPPF